MRPPDDSEVVTVNWRVAIEWNRAFYDSWFVEKIEMAIDFVCAGDDSAEIVNGPPFVNGKRRVDLFDGTQQCQHESCVGERRR